MNKEIIKILNVLLEILQTTNGEFNFYEIESNKFEAIITLVKKQLRDLQQQLEEKDKVIDEAICFIRNGREGKGQFYKCCTRKVSIEEDEELLEILERGKNGK